MARFVGFNKKIKKFSAAASDADPAVTVNIDKDTSHFRPEDPQHVDKKQLVANAITANFMLNISPQSIEQIGITKVDKIVGDIVTSFELEKELFLRYSIRGCSERLDLAYQNIQFNVHNQIASLYAKGPAKLTADTKSPRLPALNITINTQKPNKLDLTYATEATSLTGSKESLAVKIYQANLVYQDTDAIVNPANEYLLHTGGAAKEISNAAGPKMTDICNKYIERNGQLCTTQVISTPSGRLKCHFVLHAVGPRAKDFTNVQQCLEALKLTIVNVFRLANQPASLIESLSIPAISSGLFGVSKEIVAEAMYKAIWEFCGDKTPLCLREIHIVNKDDTTNHAVLDFFIRPLQMKSKAEFDDHRPNKPV